MKRVLEVLRFWRFFKPSDLKIYHAKSVFSQIDPIFKTIALPTAQNVENVAFYKLASPATFVEAFSSISANLNSLILSEEAVVKICLNYKEFLADKKQKAFFYLGGDVIAKINFYNDGLHINRYNLNNDIVWDTKNERFFIVPDLSV